MDKFSLKDSGRGDSEAGDSDYEPGRESPMDRLLGEGFTEIYAPDGQHRAHAGTSHRTALSRHEAKLQSLFCSAFIHHSDIVLIIIIRRIAKNCIH